VASRAAVHTYLVREEPDLVRQVMLPVQSADAAALLATAVVAGMTMSYGDKESWWKVAWDGAAFVCTAGSHFGPEGARDDRLTRAQFVAEWRGRWQLNRGRLEGYQRRWIDQALAYLQVPTLRRYLDRPSAPS